MNFISETLGSGFNSVNDSFETFFTSSPRHQFSRNKFRLHFKEHSSPAQFRFLVEFLVADFPFHPMNNNTKGNYPLHSRNFVSNQSRVAAKIPFATTENPFRSRSLGFQPRSSKQRRLRSTGPGQDLRREVCSTHPFHETYCQRRLVEEWSHCSIDQRYLKRKKKKKKKTRLRWNYG